MKKTFNFGVLFLLFFISCKGEENYLIHDVPTEQPRTDKTVDVRSFMEPTVDILFVVDNSGSMGDIQQNIVSNAKIFMEEFMKTNFLKWRMGVVSTDKDDVPYLGFDQAFDEKTPNPVQVFSDAIGSLGVYGSGWEYVFYNTLRHLTDPQNSFIRRKAHLAVIMVTDEPEQSVDSYGAQYEALTFINSLKSLKSAEKITRFYGAFNFGDLAGCSSSSVYYAESPFEKVINETGGMYMSACASDFGIKLAAIGKDIVEFVDAPSITLNTRPIIPTIKVYYNGEELKGGPRDEGGIWYYDKYYNTVNFYSMNFSSSEEDSDVRIVFDIDDGVDRS